jgi:hypothetical protein
VLILKRLESHNLKFFGNKATKGLEWDNQNYPR